TTPQHRKGKEREPQHSANAPRLLDEAVQPFESCALHPDWRTLRHACNKIECAANTHCHADIKPGQIPCNPLILIRCAIGHEQYISIAGSNHRGDIILLLRGWTPRISSSDLQTRIAF